MGRDAVEGITDLLALPRRLGHLTGHLLIDGLCLLPGLGNKALALGGRLAPEALRLPAGLIQESLCLGLRLGQYIGCPLLGVQLQLGHPLLFPAEGRRLRLSGRQGLPQLSVLLLQRANSSRTVLGVLPRGLPGGSLRFQGAAQAGTLLGKLRRLPRQLVPLLGQRLQGLAQLLAFPAKGLVLLLQALGSLRRLLLGLLDICHHVLTVEAPQGAAEDRILHGIHLTCHLVTLYHKIGRLTTSFCPAEGGSVKIVKGSRAERGRSCRSGPNSFLRFSLGRYTAYWLV